MASVKLNHTYKIYENGTNAVSDFNIEIEDKEFIAFVGSSGCGKSTNLRMIACLEDITAGDLFIDGKLVNELETKNRDVAMVFQNYALYPHMTVFNNMAFGLHIACKDVLVFCLNEEALDEGQEVSFDIDFTKVIVNEDEKVVVNEIPDYNHIIGRLHRIKALVPVERKGKTIQKKKTGFQFDIAGTYIDVPYEMYDKTLAVLVKKFELHKIKYSFKTSLVASKEEGIEIELKKATEYGKELHYGVFPIKQSQEEIVLRLPEYYKNADKLYLKLNYEYLKARDTHFDIGLK